MTATDIAAYGGLIISACGLVGLPFIFGRRKERERNEHTESLDSREVAKMFRAERDSLQARLDHVIGEYEQRITGLKADYERKLAEADARHQAQIAGLRAEIDTLYKRLYGSPPSAAT